MSHLFIFCDIHVRCKFITRLAIRPFYGVLLANIWNIYIFSHTPVPFSKTAYLCLNFFFCQFTAFIIFQDFILFNDPFIVVLGHLFMLFTLFKILIVAFSAFNFSFLINISELDLFSMFFVFT